MRTFTSASAPETAARALASRTSARSSSFFNWARSSLPDAERGVRDELIGDGSAMVMWV